MPKKISVKRKPVETTTKPMKSSTDVSIDEVKSRAVKSLERIFTKRSVCESIANALEKKYSGEIQSFRNELRVLLIDLDTNKLLKERLEDEKMTAEELVEMKPDERMEDNLKKKLEQIEKNENDKMMTINLDEWPDSLDLCCRKCKGRKVKEYQLQMRSADEPMTRVITCLKCGNEWKQSC